MNFGMLNERVIVQQSTDAANSLGETIQTWATFATVWAGIDERADRTDADSVGQSRAGDHQRARG